VTTGRHAGLAALALAAGACGFPQPTFDASTPDAAGVDAQVQDAPADVSQEAAEAAPDTSSETSADASAEDSAQDDVQESGADADGGCAPGFKPCGGGCVQVSDPDYGCSASGCDPCAVPNAVAKCSGALCAVQSCNSGWTDCNQTSADGCEVATAADSKNCGSCGNECQFPHAAASCELGVCKRGACDNGFDDCDGVALSGCEGDLLADPKHCGSCANACSTSGGTPVCNAGQCGFSSCTPPMEDCDKDPSHTCETNLQTTLGHCGFCGNACTLVNASATCVSGNCVLDACVPGFGNCDSIESTGCEVNLKSSVQNCGACAIKCPSPVNSTAVCASGTCAFQCQGAFDNCNNNVADGCEVDTGSDPLSCGACGFPCALAHATSGCSGGQCTIAQCESGFASCDGNVANGCESELATDTGHCGSCSNACPVRANATTTCVQGQCGFSCVAGFMDCDALASNGCEKAKKSWVSEVEADAPVAWWRLGESSGTAVADTTGHGHTGVYSNVTLGVPGAIACDKNTAAKFTGSLGSQVSVPRHPALEPASSLTVEAWFQQNGTPTLYSMVVWYGDTNVAPWGSWGFERQDTNPNIFTALIASDPTEAWADLSGIAVDTWYHAAFTYDGANLRSYVNGVMTGINDTTGKIRYDGVHGMIMGSSSPGYNVFNGLIDEVAVYDKVLSAARLLAHYQAGVP
jgi:hypothetical protein